MLVFATRNKHKIRELNSILQGLRADVEIPEIVGLDSIYCDEEIEENSDTIRGNAIQKAKYVHANYTVNCFAEDTGLEIDALNGEPGVHSARYAGDQRNSEDNIDLVLRKLKPEYARTARFRTVIALYIENQLHTFEGVAEGRITHERRGEEGFGYDSIFSPLENERTFAQMGDIEKNKISHRNKALQLMISFFQSRNV